ncbi:metallophosphoesterase family protein [Gulosibacter sediminis]|uniref:metallophosphoesterase family protein n=1 Tax=Gulosibacter sediminis TaxID=1729695 RepID=UPI0024A9E75A|nr:metallophosphoesterase family protein [Gulosibacter sediminis]
MDDNPATEATEPSVFDFDQVDFVTSDHHFGHARIIELAERPFASLDEMHGELIAAWNRLVGPEDVVLHLGDLALGNREESIGVTAALNGRKLLVPGNHDTISSVYRCTEAHKQQTRDLLDQWGWEVLPENLIGTRSGLHILASHYPYRGDSQSEERHAEARPADEGLPLLHGHTHHRNNGAHGHMFHVGVDGNDFAPVPMTVIDEWLDRLGGDCLTTGRV